MNGTSLPAWELPVTALHAARNGYDAVIAIGCVIRGDTPHFDYVAGEASRGLADASAEFETPVGFGLLTCDTMAQAEARAGGFEVVAEAESHDLDGLVAAVKLAASHASSSPS